MNIQYWSKPVELRLPGTRRVRAITGTLFASECLLTAWPAPAGGAHADALRQCVEALNGRSQVQTARDAFIAAAREAELDIVAS